MYRLNVERPTLLPLARTAASAVLTAAEGLVRAATAATS